MSGLKNIISIYLIRIKKIKDSMLNSNNSREPLIFLFFLLIAAMFWLSQTLSFEYETEVSIPVQVKDTSNIILTSEPVNKLQIVVRDRGTILLHYIFIKQFVPLTIDFTEYSHAKNNHIRILTAGLRKSIHSQLNVSTQLLSVKPDTLEYIYVSGKSKRVPVKLTGNITADRQHYLSDTIFSSDSVLVYALSNVLDTITAAYTQPVELQNISDTVKYLSAFSHIKGVKFVPESVELTFPVDVYTEKMLEIPIHSTGFPPNKILRTFPSKVQVTVQIGLKNFYEINSENFSIEISYDDLLKCNTERYSVKLKNIPQEVNQILHIVPEQIDFLIETISL